MIEKICNKCKISKKLEEFNKDKSRKDGYTYRCKLCLGYLSLKYYRNNIDQMLLKFKEYYDKHSKEHILRNKIYIKNNYTKHSIYIKKWTQENIDNIRIYKRKYKNYKYNNDENYRIEILLRSRITSALKNQNTNKISPSLKLLGCTIFDFKEYLESQFKQGMTWENHGKIWEIDHIIGCCNFDLTKLEEQEKCFHYTNCQPLFKNNEIAESFGYKNYIGNRNKGAKIL